MRERAAVSPLERFGLVGASGTEQKRFLDTISEEEEDAYLGLKLEAVKASGVQEYRRIEERAESSSQARLDRHVDVVEGAIRVLAQEAEITRRRDARRHAIVIFENDDWTEWSGFAWTEKSESEVLLKRKERSGKGRGLKRSLKKVLCQKN
jgi:hypothetical protein